MPSVPSVAWNAATPVITVRAGVYEIMQLSDGIKALISPDTDLLAVRRQAFKEGMRSLRLSGAQKVAAGLTTIEEVLRVDTPERAELSTAVLIRHRYTPAMQLHRSTHQQGIVMQIGSVLLLFVGLVVAILFMGFQGRASGL